MPKAQLQYLTDELNKLREQKLYQKLRVLETEQLPVSRFDGREVINLSSNNYLGLTTHPKLRARALEAIEKWGVGSGAVRTIAGTMAIHMELEEKIAKFKHVEASVVFQSGFTANAGTVQAILGREDIIVSDQLNHASIIDGCRLSRAEIKVFPHKDMEACENILRGNRRPQVPQAAHHGRGFLHGGRHRPVAAARRAGREVRLHHDD